MQESLSTFLVVGLDPNSALSEGRGASSPRSISSRTAGTAQISEWVVALPSKHHAAAAVFAVRRSTAATATGTAFIASGAIRSALA